MKGKFRTQNNTQYAVRINIGNFMCNIIIRKLQKCRMAQTINDTNINWNDCNAKSKEGMAIFHSCVLSIFLSPPQTNKIKFETFEFERFSVPYFSYLINNLCCLHARNIHFRT